MKNLVFAANWKMNLSLDDVIAYCHRVYSDFNENPDFRLNFLQEGHQFFIFAPAPYLFPLQNKVRELNLPIKVGAQKISHQPSGAYTGEVSASMVKSIGLDWVLIGHSERRTIFSESMEQIAQQTVRALENGLNVMFCIGETLQERQSGQTEKVLNEQIQSLVPFLQKIDSGKISNRQIFWAYEPVWAIGTGVAASVETVAQTHLMIKNILKNTDIPIGKSGPLLYGGSLNPQNAKEIFSVPNVEGGLVGSVSLKWDNFSELIKAGMSF